MKITGISGSPGIAVGQAVLLRKTPQLSKTEGKVEDVNAEIARFRKAVESFCVYTQERAKKLEILAGKADGDILRAHCLIAQDPYVKRQIEAEISDFQCAEAAVTKIFDEYIALLLKVPDCSMSLRTSDIQDVHQALLKLLQGFPLGELSEVGAGNILIGDELLPSELISAASRGVGGVVLTGGGKASHCAILACSLNIPLVMGATDIWKVLSSGEIVIVDGTRGYVLTAPSAQLLREYEEQKKMAASMQTGLQEYTRRKTMTADGTTLLLTANICHEDEIPKTLEYGGEGIGLFRSEFLLFGRETPPGEEEQFEVYRDISQKMQGLPVTIRVADVGGDKDISCLHVPKEENPALGCRGIRFCLQEKEFFTNQVRAVLRAGFYGKVSLLLPMVTMVREVRKIKEMVEEAKADLRQRGLPFDEKLPLGVMIETPAAAVMADRLATEVDFLSIGTNDLTQYLLSADRGNAQVSDLYSYYAPAMVRMLSYISRCVQGEGVPLYLCGEAASDPLFLPILIALGLDELSMRPAVIPFTRRAVSLWSTTEAVDLFRRALQMETEQEVRNLLEENQRF